MKNEELMETKILWRNRVDQEEFLQKLQTPLYFYQIGLQDKINTLNEIHTMKESKKTNILQYSSIDSRLWKAFSGKYDAELFKKAFEKEETLHRINTFK